MDLQFKSHLPIAQLQPSVETSGSYLRGIVTLIWPYSSSNQSFSVLLVEPDFRLRRYHGQVRISFKGACAKAVAKSGLTSGDEVLVGLLGAEWAQEDTVIRTPGRGVDWELQFGQRLVLQVLRDTREPNVLDIDRSSVSPVLEPTSTTPPRSPGQEETLGSPYRNFSLNKAQNWASPAFLKRKSLPVPSAFNSLYDPFEEDNDLLDEQRRKRLKFGRGSGHWRFSDRTPSPEKQDEETVADRESSLLQEDVVAELSQTVNPELQSELPIDSQLLKSLVVPDVDISRSSPARLAIDTQAVTPKSFTSDDGDEGVQIPEQPRLKPLLSAGLPLVSPLMQRKGKVSDYFQYGAEEEPSKRPDFQELTLEGSTGIIQDGRLWDVAEEHSGKMDSPKSDSSTRPPIGSSNGESLLQSISQEFVKLQEKAGQYAEYEETPSQNEVEVSPENEFPQEDVHFLAGDTPPEEPISKLFSESWRLEAALHKVESIKHSSEVEEQELVAIGAAESKLHLQEFEQEDWVRANKVEGSDSPVLTEAPEAWQDLVDEPIEELGERHLSESESYYIESDDREDEGMTNEEDEKGYITEDEEIDSLSVESEVEHSSEADASDGETEGGANRPLEVISIDSEDEEGSDVGIPQFDGSSLYANIEIPKYRRAFSVEEEQRELVSARLTRASEEARERTAPEIAAEHADQGGSDIEIPHLDGSFILASTETPNNRRDVSAVEKDQQELESENSSRAPREETGVSVSILATEDTVLGTCHENATLFKDRRLLPFTPEASGVSKLLLEGENSREYNVHYPLLPETTLEGQESPFPQSERGVSQDVYDTSPRDHLLTPLATQPLQSHALGPESVGEVETVDNSPEISKPSHAQERSDDEIAEVTAAPFNPLIGKLRELRNSSGSLPTGSIHGQGYPDIGVWFNGGKDGQNDITDDPSAISGEESDEESVDLVDPENKADESAPPVATPSQAQERSKAETLAAAALETSTYIGFSTPLSYFAPLSTLAQHFNTTIDVFTTIVSATKIARSNKGPRDYFETLYISDPSSATSDSVPPITAVQIFRPYKPALPLAQTGDVILLRNFKVQTQKQKPMLLSTESSAWAVFHKGHEPQIRGPQLEFGAQERGFAKGMIHWWSSLDEETRASLVESVPKAEKRVKSKGKEKVSGRASMASVHELRDGTKYTDGRADGMNGIHELRDGTVYADDKA
ncbi:hypothetical protein MMC30_002894 [Trapelia coarctata]|nr:hypothetical protein [Trapelia coarctata]